MIKSPQLTTILQNTGYPFPSHWMDMNGVSYHYIDEGLRDAPVLLMVHGNPTWSFYFRHLITEFSRDFRVIAPDHIGCGLSEKPQQYAYTLEQHITNLEQLCLHLDLHHVTLVVHDWGGAIGMGAAVRHPERIQQFVIFNTSAFFVPVLPLRISICRIPVIGEFLVRGLNGFARAALRYATSQPERFTNDVKSGYLAPYSNWHDRIALHRFVRDIPMEDTHSTRRTLNEIDKESPRFQHHPMLILWGKDDFCFTERDFLPEWRRRFPEADVHVLEHAGHYVVEDAHERIIPLMSKFLERDRPAAKETNPS